MSPNLHFPLPRRRSPVALTALTALTTFLPAASGAVDAAPPPGVSFATMMQTFAGLAVILALFVGAAWLVRRINGGRPLTAGDGPMRIIGSQAIGPRERIVLIEIEETWLVIGIAPGQMRTLHTLPKGTVPEEVAAEGQFGHWLKQFRDQRNEKSK